MIKLQMIGKVTNVPKVFEASGGKKAKTIVNMVTSVYGGKNQDGSIKYDDVWVKAVSWDQRAERMAKLEKGDQVFIEGRPVLGKPWGDENRVDLECWVDDFEKVFTGSAKPKAEQIEDDEDETEVEDTDSDGYFN